MSLTIPVSRLALVGACLALQTLALPGCGSDSDANDLLPDGGFRQDASAAQAGSPGGSGADSGAGGNASGGNASGGNASGGNASGGNASGGNASGGNASGGNASGGNASGGNASGGNASGGNAAGADGGSASGGNASGNADAGSPGAGTPGGGTPGGDAERVDNPYVGAKGYVNPEWQAKANAEPGGARVANTPTAVWIDRIAAIKGTAASVSNGPMGVREHLDGALKQGAGYIQFVIYNLPGRDCSALASNGELGPTDLPRYKSEYIDPIVAIMGEAKYRPLRIVNIIEVDSLPNLVTNTSVQKCAQMKDNGGYVQGVSYALQKLGGLPNTYNYVDAGHHGWLGWMENFDATAALFAQVGNMAGIKNVHGFITNSANYSALQEPFLDPNASVGGMQLKQAKWVDWNPYVDELSFAQAFRTKLVGAGFDSKIGMLIDTSRNGWGGAARPAAKSAATDLEMFVNQSRIDRRIHAGNWCNQSGAGMGERPKAAPSAGIDAYVWIKPPGESDGASKEIQNSEGKGFDRMCDPTYGGNERNGNSTTGALADSPLAGAWFSAQFQELMRNAYPAL
jgi:cellulose 1,4-beta-cellobiosidase